MVRRIRYLTAALGLGLAVMRGAAAGEAPAAPTSPTVAGAGATTETSESRAYKWLALLQKRHADHGRVEGEFTQVRKDPVFLEDIASTGTFYFQRPNLFRCNYTKPPENASQHLVVGDLVESYYPSIKQVERYRMQHEGLGIADTNYMLLAFGVDTDEIRKYFTVTDEPTTVVDRVRLVFAPRAPEGERPFKKFVLDLTQSDMQPVRFEIEGEKEDYTVVKINKITWNPRWEDDSDPQKFQLKYPPDVETINLE